MKAKILNASAGSGKTYQLAYKYVRDVIEHPGLYRHILAVTFTNKATEEMKSRILNEIHLLASEQPSKYLGNLCEELPLDERSVRLRAREVRSKILHDYSRFTVLTIDTFFQRILRAFIQELGLDLNYNVEIETASVLTKSADSLVEQIASDRELKRWMMAFVQERIDEGKRWDVREGILSLGGELFKERNKQALATARSKEELQRIVGRAVERCKDLRSRMQEVGRKAMAVMDEAGVTPSDYTNKSRSFAHYFASAAAGEFKAYSPTVERMSRTTEGWCKGGSAAEATVALLQPMLGELCRLYDAGERMENTAGLLRENYRSFALLSDLYAKVQELCREESIQLLSETKYLLSAFIEHNDAPFIYEKVGNRFDRFMIDEFQDTSRREWENFLPLLRNAMSQTEPADTSVLIVGDIKQSIYRWRGGDWRILHETARQQLGPEDTEVKTLRENYRSLGRIVEFNNEMIEQAVRSDNAALDALLDRARQQGVLTAARHAELRGTLADAYRDHRQTARRKSDRAGYVSLTACGERPPLIERIREILDRGFKPRDILILVRGSYDGARIAAELLDFKRTNRDERYRFDVMTQEALVIGNAPAAAFIAAALRLALNPDDTINRAIYNRYLGGRAFDRPLSDDERAFFRSLRLLPPEEAFERIVIRHGLQRDAGQRAYLQAVHEQIVSFCSGKVADIPLFLAWWDEQGCKRSLSVGESERTIEITTIHKAKGLEKPVVMIPYCDWDLDPKTSGWVDNIVWAQPDGETEELGSFPVRFKKAMAQSEFAQAYYAETVYSHVDNVNLLYVALTRAVEALHLFVPDPESQKRSGPTVGKLMLDILRAQSDGETARAGSLEGRITRRGEETVYEFGTFDPPERRTGKPSAAEQRLLDDYPTTPVELRLRLPSQRYFEEADAVELSPRNFGILMHRAFEEAATKEEIGRAVERMRLDGILSAAGAETLQRQIDRTLEHPAARSWFDGHWRIVRNEHEIIVPGSRSTRRPDRVMIDGERAVVVDYKFGQKDPAAYRRQIAEYMTLLREIGYTQVEGYLWFVSRGEIQRVENP